MKISELRKGAKNVDVRGVIIEISEPREVNTIYGKKLVANATLEDESGRIKLSLWEKQIQQVRVGDIVEIKNGYLTEFRDELQLNVGKYGKILVVRKE
ncbi:MAG: OB-fold nucleic acid binding domain-containing protein [Candidatus Nanoarchaeia archaeon]|nr:OB-fold nucleic acid binding domain-containing protein [Candidatus Haiyanarchaeum thermophilum]MCW1303836.1 OB-fold nucleic acid binding domain-containing protein [Candidatus Haiyanarchaeum thermophilum]MCW1306547.1 OB-fold nucleic acid binding domain-containing protein [Candidatus Haiyanarchaeum thermophilum]MCW1306961.1 OB-fold nucleic acid binding domain-containing protein [Candidatus Haiyanarchaeum thermophilum]MCW1307631.1 OB-fold nucleic acid binding domain-containing protein [Candidat